jgi:hypothetical protein
MHDHIPDEFMRRLRDFLAALEPSAELSLRTGLALPRVSAKCLQVLRAVVAGEPVDPHDLAVALREAGEALKAEAETTAGAEGAEDTRATAAEADASPNRLLALFRMIAEDGASLRIEEAMRLLAVTTAYIWYGVDDLAATRWPHELAALATAVKEDGATARIVKATDEVLDEYLTAGLTAEAEAMLREVRARRGGDV